MRFLSLLGFSLFSLLPAAETSLENFASADAWKKATATVEATVGAEGNVLSVAVPYVTGKRAIFGLAKGGLQAELGGDAALVLEANIPRKSQLTVEATVDGKLVRVLNYREGKGDWETLRLPLKGKVLAGITLHFGQGAVETGASETRTTRVRRIRLEEGGAPSPALVPSSPKAAPSVFSPYVDGDRVATIGDSITHNGLYHAFVVDFYLTRYPGAKVVFFNRGISGDTAGGVLSRWDWDVTSRDFNRATVMLGMNDVNRNLYGKDDPDEATLKAREDAIDAWKRNITEIQDRLVAKGVRVALVTPSIYDDTSAQTNTKNLFGVNGALARCAELNAERAKEKGFGLIDFQGPLRRLNGEVQKTNAEATIIGKDRVHPAELGHLIMASRYLIDQGVEPEVARLEIDAVARTAKATGATVEDLSVTGGSIAFTYRPERLPFPAAPGYQAADALVDLTGTLNREILSFSGLTEGEWTLSMDGVELGRAPASAWKAGVNLATNASNAGQIQAMSIHATNFLRRSVEAQLRNIVMVEMNFARAKIDPSDAEAVKTFCEEQVAKNKKPGGNPFLANLFNGYLTLKPRQQAILKQVDDLWAQLWTMNRPAARKMILRKAEG